LVYFLRIRNTLTSRLVVPLINEDSTPILDLIFVGRVRAERHKDYRVIATKPEIHASLEANTLTTTHLKV